MRFVTAYDIATDICFNLGDDNLSRIGMVLRNVINAANDAHNSVLPSVKSDLFTIPANLALPLPESSGLVTKVGVVTDKGRLMMLFPDSAIRREHHNTINECVDVDAVPETSLAEINYYNCAESCSGPWYGYRQDIGGAGTYRHDVMKQTIEFGSGRYVAEGQTVLVEYQNHGSDRYTLIPEEAKQLIYQRALFLIKSAKSPQEAEYHFRQFRTEYDQYKRLMIRRDPAVYIRALQKNHNSSPK